MKKKAMYIILISIIAVLFMCTSQVYATVSEVVDENVESQLIEIKDNTAKTLEDYEEKYGSAAYGLTAYILNLIRIYSIPLCFLGIALSAIYQYVLGVRKLDLQSKGLVLMVTFVTLLVICQILPLAFAIAVKFGRG